MTKEEKLKGQDFFEENSVALFRPENDPGFTHFHINGKFYEKISDEQSNSYKTERMIYYTEIAQNINHPHNKDIDLVKFSEEQKAARKRGDDFIKNIKTNGKT